MESDVAYRLLRLEQRLVSYEQLHAQELGEMRQELDTLKRHVVLQNHALLVRVNVAMCTGCSDCLPACPQSLFELHIVEGRRIASVIAHVESERAQACAECQSGKPPCVAVCTPGAILLE